WIRHLFGFVYPGNGVVGEIDTSSIFDSQLIMRSLQTCIAQYLVGIDSNPTSHTDLSSLVTGYSLATHLDAQDVAVRNFRVTSTSTRNPASLKQLDDPDMYKPSMKDQLSSFIDRSDANGLTEATERIRIILGTSTRPLDITFMVHLIEMITRDMIYHNHYDSANQDNFSGLILPLSWARLLAKQYSSRPTIRDTNSLPGLLESIVWLADELKYGDRRHWLVGGKSLSSQSKVHMMDRFQLRLCWCIALLLVNSSHSVGFVDPVMNSLIHLAGDLYGRIAESPCQRFGSVIDQETCLEAFCQTFYQEPMVLLSDGSEEIPEWFHHHEILVVIYSDPQSLLGELRKAAQPYT
ncbi:unnamed protein product, partial [Rhizoctonia solani]